jgi:hypothetical protein
MAATPIDLNDFILNDFIAAKVVEVFVSCNKNNQGLRLALLYLQGNTYFDGSENDSRTFSAFSFHLA